MQHALEMELKSSKNYHKLDNEDESTSIQSLPTRLGQCEVCGAQAARYSCPKCEVKTCSLQCVNIHKKELECNGIRDRTKYIPIRKMTKMDFMNDYYFLEECTRYANARKTDCTKRYTQYNKELPSHLYKLRNAAASRKIKLRFLLQNFTRRKENSTFYNWREKRIYWRIEWVFTNSCNAQYIDMRCSEDEPIYKLLDKYVNINSQVKGLEYYQSVGVFDLQVLLKAEGIKNCRTRFYALDCAKTLRENLSGKTIVEYPCIHVSYEQNSSAFDIIDSDEDIDEETKMYNMQLEALRKEQIAKNKTKENNGVIEVDEDAKKLKELLKEKRHEERQRKREEFESTPNNFLFTNDNLMDILSSSEDDKDD